jgi:Zn-dependent protease
MVGSGDFAHNLHVAFISLPFVLLAFALHEMAHAYTATWFGDPTPARHGRRTLNPIRHLDPVGTVMLVVSMVLFGFPFGFAVTPVDDRLMRRPRLHGALVSLAGPTTNIVLCALSIIGLIVTYNASGPTWLLDAWNYSALFNAFLAVFNLLPIPPLDGGRIVGSFMNDHMRREWRKIDEYGIFIILGLVLLGGASFSAFLQSMESGLLHVIGFFVDSAGFQINV